MSSETQDDDLVLAEGRVKMFDYQSPITQIVSDMQMEYENGVLKAVQNVGFHVDKEELAKALVYDRGQYEKGYEDGFKDGAESVRALAPYETITNADRIRSMTDEELAEFLTFNGFCNASPLCPHRNDDIQCEQCVIEWLKSEVKE